MYQTHGILTKGVVDYQTLDCTYKGNDHSKHTEAYTLAANTHTVAETHRTTLTGRSKTSVYQSLQATIQPLDEEGSLKGAKDSLSKRPLEARR